jgi:hypothetical protein
MRTYAVLVALAVFAAGFAPGLACGGPCCPGPEARVSHCSDTTAAAVTAPEGCCCTVQGGGPLAPAEETMRAGIVQPSGGKLIISAHLPAEYERLGQKTTVFSRASNLMARGSPPLYKLTSTYLC